MKLFIFNDSPYGSQMTFNGLRVAAELSRTNSPIAMFSAGRRSGCRLEASEMLRVLARNGVLVAACTTCLQARGITDAALVSGVQRGTLEGLTNLIDDAEKILSF